MGVERTCDAACGRAATVRTLVGVYDGAKRYEWTCSDCVRVSDARPARGYTSKRDERLWYKFKIRESDWETMSAAQGGLCWICQEPPGAKGLMVDHCHETGDVRALLCGRCNSGLGMFADDVVRLERAQKYLMESWNSNSTGVRNT